MMSPRTIMATRKFPDKPAPRDPHRPATLADVAARAGVVAMTASRAINQSGYVSDDVRKRVLQAAEELNYRPNVLARQLKLRRSNAVGMLLPDVANPFSAELVNGVKSVLDPVGIATFLVTSNRSVEQEIAGLQALTDHRVDGLIVATRGTQMGDEVLRNIARQGTPLVTIGRPLKLAAVDSITADHRQGAFDAVSHLISLGHQRIGFIGIAPEDSHSLRRYCGYMEALQAAGLPVDPDYTVGPADTPAYATQEDGYDGMMKLAALPEPPTAVFARNDFTAMGALRAANILGLRVPQDVAIAAFDNVPLASYTTPPLTTVEQPIAQQGAEAARLLLERIREGNAAKARAITLPCKLIIRESTNGAK